jgi:hypothetical protein
MNSKVKIRFVARKIAGIILRISVMVCMMYIFYVWTSQPSRVFKNTSGASRYTNIFPLSRNAQEFTGEERRIARHFALDTLPGLMQRGLIVKFERRHNGTLVHVAGRLWKERSKFFKESLISEVSIYNKVNGYAIETRIVDHCSQRLYAQVLSLENKEIFN